MSRKDGRRKWGCWLCKVLDWMDEDHCNEAVKGDRCRAEAVIKELDGY